MTLAGWILVVICSMAVVAGNALLRLAVRSDDKPLFESGLLRGVGELLELAARPSLLLSLCLYAVGMLIWLRLLATQPISMAYPTLAAMTFVAIVVVGTVLFGEDLGTTKLVGLGMTLAGVLILASA